MTFTIGKDFTFSAAHQLSSLPEHHKCHRLHGHNYSVTVVLRADRLDDNGFVVDYGDLSPIRDFIDGRLDHRNLSELFTFPVTAENLAAFLFNTFREQFPNLVEVIVCETPTTWASYEPKQ